MLCVFHCNYECYIIINIAVYERRKVYILREESHANLTKQHFT